MSDTLSLYPGDIIQMDRGPVIVESVGSKTADCIDLKTGKSRECPSEVAKHLIVERRGAEGLAKFLADDKPVKRGMVRLEIGDRLCVKAKVCTVIQVIGKGVMLGDLDGNEWLEDRVVNDFLMTDCQTDVVSRLDKEQRAEQLKQFLAQRKQPPQREAVETSGANTETQDKVMAKKNKVAKEKKAKVPKTDRVNHSYAGRSELIEKGVIEELTDAQIRASVKEVFPTSSPCDVDACIKSKRAKAKKNKEKAAKE